MNKDNKRIIIISTIVLVIALILSVVGVSYAFFNLQINGEDTTTKIEISTGDANGIVLSGKVENFHITVDADDMAYNNMGYYYATDSQEKNYVKNKEDGIKNLGTIEIKGALEKPNTCDATIKVELTTDILNDIQEGDFTLGLIYGSNETEIDLKNISSEGTIIGFELDGEINLSYIQAYLKLNNANRDQSYLASQEINVKVSVEDFMCEGYEAKPVLEMLQETGGNVFAGGGDHTTAVEGLYRYKGTYEEVTNNFICIGGPKNPKNCGTVEDNKYLYRIIGVTDGTENETLGLEKGMLKVIKVIPSNISQAWAYDSSIEIDWDNVNNVVRTSINGNGFYNGLDTEIKRIISSVKWWNGSRVNANSSGIENKIPTTNQYKIGLMYAGDYYNSWPYADYNNPNTNSWLYLANTMSGKTSTYSSISEWTMSRYGYEIPTNNYRIWHVYIDGALYWPGPEYQGAIRPVFYLTPNITLSGEGTENDPFIIHTK